MNIDEVIIIRRSIMKQLGVILLGIIMVTAAGGILIFSDNTDIINSILNKVIGITGVLFFGMGLIFFVNRLISSKPILTIDKNGFADNSTGMTNGQLVRWQDVSKISISRSKVGTFIAIQLKNPDEYLKNLNIIQRSLTRLNQAMSCDIIQICLNGTNKGYDEVYEMMMYYYSPRD